LPTAANAALPAPPTIPTSAPTTPAKTPKSAPPINSAANYPISSPANTFPPAISAPPSAASCPPSSAATLSPAPPAPSYLSQTLAQTIHLSKHEYIIAFGTDAWRQAIRNSVRQNFDYRNPSPSREPPPDQAPQPASQPAPSPHTPLPPTGTEFIQHVVAGLQTGEKSSLP